MVDRKLAEADNGVGFYLCVGVGGNRCSIGVYAWPLQSSGGCKAPAWCCSQSFKAWRHVLLRRTVTTVR